MELVKTEYSLTKGMGKLDKVLLKYDEPKYYKLTEFLFTSNNNASFVIKALYSLSVT
jgi:hypothetical protein